MDPLTIFVCLLTTIAVGSYFFVRWRYSYWKRRGVYHLEPKFPYGNVELLAKRKEYFGDTFQEIYNHLRSKGVKGGGYYMFLRPIYMPVDIELVKDIQQKDFGHFVNRGRYVNKKIDPLSGNLFNIENDEWRQLRIKLTPTFTSAKMKMMFHTFVACTSELVKIIKDSSLIGDPIEIKDVLARFATDIIGSCAFGIDCSSLKNPNSEFRQFGKKIFLTDTWTSLLRNMLILALPSNILTMLRVKQLDENVETFFMNIVKDTVKYRETNDILRNDFLQLLIKLKNDGAIDDEDDKFKEGDKHHKRNQTISINELAAQCLVFFIAGYETSASTMTFALLELALNQSIQESLRNEIETTVTKHGGNVSYEAVMEMTYLDQVVNETLRKHAAGSAIFRVCNKEYQIPGTDTVLEPGTQIRISVLGIHHDPEYYPEPEKFDPERFSAENKAKRPQGSFLAFGEGPRNCIGSRFGLLQTKVGLLAIIRNFKVTLNEKTKIPIKHDPASVVTTCEGGVWLNVTQVEAH